MDYFGILLDLLLLFMPAKAKISPEDIFSCFGITLEFENLLLALLYRRLSFSIILKPTGILFRLEILLIESLDITVIPTYNVLDITPIPCRFSQYLSTFTSTWTVNGLEATNRLKKMILFLSPTKWKIKGPKSLKWDNKKGIRLG
jgi:hypothetical protein